MKPIKCRYCGAEEWRHVCEGAIPSAASSRVTPSVKPKVVVDTPRSAKPVVDVVVDASNTRSADRHRMTAERREYLRVKQRESRARRRAS